jgi:hypothetical protein
MSRRSPPRASPGEPRRARCGGALRSHSASRSARPSAPRREAPALLIETPIGVAHALCGGLDLGLAGRYCFLARSRVGGPLRELSVERSGVSSGLAKRGLHRLQLGHRLRPNPVTLPPQMPLDVPQPVDLGIQAVDLALRAGITDHATDVRSR